MDTPRSLDSFLASVERRAFRMAEFATGNADDALDIVQDAMMKLVEKYADKDPQEWAPLFYRTLQSRITDWHRRRTVRSRIMGFIGIGRDDDELSASVEDLAPAPAALQPEEHASTDEMIERLRRGLVELPVRQQQAFLLRAWEGLDVRQTAIAMACSEGSVKTHYSRALNSLRAYFPGDDQ